MNIDKRGECSRKQMFGLMQARECLFVAPCPTHQSGSFGSDSADSGVCRRHHRARTAIPPQAFILAAETHSHPFGVPPPLHWHVLARSVPPATPKYTLPAFSRAPPSFLRISCAQPPAFAHIYPCVSSRRTCEVHLALSPLAYLPARGGPSTSPISYSWQAVQARCVRGCRNSSPALLSAVHVTLVTAPVPQHCVVLLTPQAFEPHTPQTLPRTPPRAPKPAGLSLAFAHIPRAQLPAPAHDLRRTSTHTLPHPRALGHRVSKSGRVRGSPRSSFTSRRACDVTHDPDIPVRAQHVLQHHPLPRNARPRDAHAPRV